MTPKRNKQQNGDKFPSTLFVRGLEPAAKARFKIYCVERGFTLTQAIAFLMSEAIEKDLLKHDLPRRT